MSAVIETQDLAKNYGQFGALQGLNLSMPEGSVFALVGASAPVRPPPSRSFST